MRRPLRLVLLAFALLGSLSPHMALAGRGGLAGRDDCGGESCARLESLREAAMDRYNQGDYAGFLSRMELVAPRTGEDRDLYNLACGYALNGQSDRALGLLQDLVSRGATFDMAHDSDFDSLRKLPAFSALIAGVAYYEEVNRRLEPLRARAMSLYEQERYAHFVEIMEELAPTSNNDVDIYNLACGYALVGRREDALAQLEQLAARGADYGVASDSDFDSLRGHPRFQAVVAKLAGMP
jgi:hypothetical protein